MEGIGEEDHWSLVIYHFVIFHLRFLFRRTRVSTTATAQGVTNNGK
jgi:hypothetical protein